MLKKEEYGLRQGSVIVYSPNTKIQKGTSRQRRYNFTGNNFIHLKTKAGLHQKEG